MPDGSDGSDFAPDFLGWCLVMRCDTGWYRIVPGGSRWFLAMRRDAELRGVVWGCVG